MIIRAEKTKNYSVISNAILNDKRLSWQARGLAAYLLTKPDNWEINREFLADQGPDGIRAVRSALQELRTCGYITSEKGVNKEGKFAWISVLHESPVAETKPAEVKARNAPPLPAVMARNAPAPGVVKARNAPARKSTQVSTEAVSTLYRGDTERGGEAVSACGAATPPPPHPALAAYRDVFARNPNRTQAAAITAAVTDTARYRTVLTDWALKGYSPANIAGQLDVYAHGWKQRPTNGRHAHAPETPAHGSTWDSPETDYQPTSPVPEF